MGMNKDRDEPRGRNGPHWHVGGGGGTIKFHTPLQGLYHHGKLYTAEKTRKKLLQYTPSNSTRSNETFFIFITIQGLQSYTTNKIPFLTGLLTETKSVFATFTETHLNDDMDSEVWTPIYKLYRSATEVGTCGGVVMYVIDSQITNEQK